jgi:hypothetical protein
MNNAERLNLKRLIDESGCDNNTENIRRLKHSVLIRDDIRRLENLKLTHASLMSDPPRLLEILQQECNFLYSNYTDIFNKVLKNEIDLNIMSRLLAVLKTIEDENVDQHEGSVMVGKILKELYLDSAVKRADNLDREHNEMRIQPFEGKKINWREYKIQQS